MSEDKTSTNMMEGDDTLDAKGLFSKLRISDREVQGTILGSHDSDYYSMDYPKRGKCLIFNHKEFDPRTGLPVRNGTDQDKARLYCRFKELGFDVTLYQDLTVKQVEKELLIASSEDHKQYSCFVCCIMSHGEEGILFAADGKYPTDCVFAPFRGDKCPSLAGKPKIFLIQACQGDKLDCGVKVKAKESSDSGPSEQFAYRIPAQADFLIVYSTVPGYYSWRNTSHGSWFIQALCAALQKHAKDQDLLSILVIVNRRVAYDFESYVPNDTTMHLKKQVPCIVSSLTRLIRFPMHQM